MPRYRLIPLNINGLPENNGEIKWDAIAGKPATFPPDSHSHEWNAIAGKPTTFPPDAHSHEWNAIAGKPTTFPPDAHSHEWNAIAGKPATFPPTPHDHGIITSSFVPANPSKGLIWNELDTNANFLMEWVWDGLRWKSKQIFQTFWQIQSVAASTTLYFPIKTLPLNYNVFLRSLVATFTTNSPNDSSNYWEINLTRIASNKSSTSIATINSKDLGVGAFDVGTNINLLLGIAEGLDAVNYSVRVVKIQSAGAMNSVCPVVSYQWARP